MNYKMMGRFLSQIIAIEAVFMLPALACTGENISPPRVFF